MFVLVLAAEADETRQAITFLIVCLVAIAALLAMLTVWYWHFTSPRRRTGLIPVRFGPSGPPPPRPGDAIVGPAVAAIGSSDPGSDVVDETVEDRPPLVGSGAPTRIEVADRSTGRDRPAVARIEMADRHEAQRRVDSAPAAIPRPPDPPAAVPPRSAAPPPPPPPQPSAAAPSGSNTSARPESVGAAGDDQPQAKPAKVQFHPGGPATDPAAAASVAALIARSVSGSTDGATPTIGSRPSPPGDRPTMSEDGGTAGRRPEQPTGPGVRRRSDEMLTDEDWASVMKSAFDKLHQ